MPVSFQYTRVGETEPEILDTVDQLMCEMSGEPFDEKRYCSGFQFLQYLGTGILCWGSNRKIGDGYQTDKETVEAFLKSEEDAGRPYNEYHKLLIRRFFYEEFTYKAWR